MSHYPRVRACDLRAGTIIGAYKELYRVESCSPYGPRRTRIKMVNVDREDDHRSVVVPNNERVSIFRAGKQLPPGVVRFFVVSDVCIEAERFRIDTVKYTKAERKWLHAILDKIEAADFEGLANVLETKPRAWCEYLGLQIHEFLQHLCAPNIVLTKQQVVDLP